MADNYEIKNGTLTVNKDLRRDFDLSFDQACSDLLASDTTQLTINLGSASYINSTYIGMIAATFFQAQANNKKLTLIAQPSVIQIFKAAGFEGFINLQET